MSAYSKNIYSPISTHFSFSSLRGSQNHAHPARYQGCPSSRPQQPSCCYNYFELSSMAIQLIQAAAFEKQEGNIEQAADLYMKAIENILLVLADSDESQKADIQMRLLHCAQHEAFLCGQPSVLQCYPISSPSATPRSASPSRDSRLPTPQSQSPSPTLSPHPPTLSDTIVRAAIAGAVALKQSPIPNAINQIITFGIGQAKQIDRQYLLKEKMYSIGKASLNKAVEIDHTYQLHQKVGLAALTSLSAITQAAMAYQNAPTYEDWRRQSRNRESTASAENFQPLGHTVRHNLDWQNLSA